MSENHFYTFENNVLNPTLECMQLEQMMEAYAPELIGKELQLFFYKQLEEFVDHMPDFLSGYVKLHEISLRINPDGQDFYSTGKPRDALAFLDEVIGSDFSEKLDMNKGSNRTIAQVLQICAKYDLIEDEPHSFFLADRLMAIDPSNQVVPAWAAYLALNRCDAMQASTYAKGLKLSPVEDLMLSSCIDYIEDTEVLEVHPRASALAGLIEAKIRCPSIMQILDHETVYVSQIKPHSPGTGYGPQPNMHDFFTGVYLMVDGQPRLCEALRDVFESDEVLQAEKAFHQYTAKYQTSARETMLKNLCSEAASTIHERVKEALIEEAKSRPVETES